MDLYADDGHGAGAGESGSSGDAGSGLRLAHAIVLGPGAGEMPPEVRAIAT